MKTIVFLSTLHRSAKRFIPVLENLSKDFEILILNVGQASDKTNYSDSKSYQEKIKKFKTINSIGIKSQVERNNKKYTDDLIRIYSSLDFKNISCVILDDTRDKNKENFLFSKCFKEGIPVIGNSHGYQEFKTNKTLFDSNCRKAFNYFFAFGKNEKDALVKTGCDENLIFYAGIPENDRLEKVKNQKSNDYILVITNFLMPHQCSGNFRSYDKKVLQQLNLLELQKKFNKKVIFKIKHRLNTDINLEIQNLKSNIPEKLDYEIIVNCDDEDDMISKSLCVLSYGSTLALKAIQLGIPTAIFKNLGISENFKEYPYVFSVGDDYSSMFDIDKEKINKFLDNCLEGGKTFTSTVVYSSKVREIVDKHEQLRKSL